MMKKAVTASLLSSLLLLGAACGERKNDGTDWMGNITDTTGTAAATAGATHPGSPGGTAIVPEVDSGTTVLVVLEDGSIGMREQAIPPGPAVFTIENRGEGVHNLYIEGDQINRAAGDLIRAGGSSTMDVILRPGAYTVYCPVADHRRNGEEIRITVGGASPPVAGTTPDGTDTAGATGTGATTGT